MVKRQTRLCQSTYDQGWEARNIKRRRLKRTSHEKILQGFNVKCFIISSIFADIKKPLGQNS